MLSCRNISRPSSPACPHGGAGARRGGTCSSSAVKCSGHQRSIFLPAVLAVGTRRLRLAQLALLLRPAELAAVGVRVLRGRVALARLAGAAEIDELRHPYSAPPLRRSVTKAPDLAQRVDLHRRIAGLAQHVGAVLVEPARRQAHAALGAAHLDRDAGAAIGAVLLDHRAVHRVRRAQHVGHVEHGAARHADAQQPVGQRARCRGWRAGARARP